MYAPQQVGGGGVLFASGPVNGGGQQQKRIPQLERQLRTGGKIPLPFLDIIDASNAGSPITLPSLPPLPPLLQQEGGPSNPNHYLEAMRNLAAFSDARKQQQQQQQTQVQTQAAQAGVQAPRPSHQPRVYVPQNPLLHPNPTHNLPQPQPNPTHLHQQLRPQSQSQSFPNNQPQSQIIRVLPVPTPSKASATIEVCERDANVADALIDSVKKGFWKEFGGECEFFLSFAPLPFFLPHIY